MQRKITEAGIRSPLRRLRHLLRRNRLAFQLVQRARRWRDERDYRRLRERYASMAPAWLDSGAELERQRSLLARTWRGPARVLDRPESVRLFVATGELDTTPTFSHELQRNFDVEVFNYVDYLPASRADLPKPEWRDRLQREILTRFREGHERRPFDLALLYVTHLECTRDTLLRIREAGVPAAVLCMDDKHSFEETPGVPSGQRPLIGAATLHLTNSLECVRWYTAEGVASYFFRVGADPEIFRPLDVQKDIPVSFVGGWYGARRDFITSLRKAGIPVRCWGPETEGGVVSREEMVRIFNRTKINLGFGGVAHTASVTCLKTRDLEVPMTGNVYLTQYNHELAMLFHIGREILCYLNEVDAVEQIRYWLAQDSRLAEIGAAARERSLRSHTWTIRMCELLRWMGILRQ